MTGEKIVDNNTPQLHEEDLQEEEIRLKLLGYGTWLYEQGKISLEQLRRGLAQRQQEQAQVDETARDLLSAASAE